MIHPQQPSGMPTQKYVPFQEPDRGRAARPHVARPGDDQGPALVRGRPARRQPGAHRPDGRRAQDAHVQAAREDGLQGDRGRLPEREPDRLRLLPRAHRRRPHPRRRDDPGAHPVPGPPHRAHLRRDPRQQAGDRALLQLDLGAPAPRRVRDERGGHHRHRPPGRPAVPQARGDRSPRPTSTTSTPRSRTPAPSSSSRCASATRSSRSSTRRPTTR